MRFFCTPTQAQTGCNFSTSFFNMMITITNLAAVSGTQIAKNVLDDDDLHPLFLQIIGLGFAAAFAFIPAITLAIIHTYCHYIENKYETKEYELTTDILIKLENNADFKEKTALTRADKLFTRGHLVFDTSEMTAPYLTVGQVISFALPFLGQDDTYWETGTFLLIFILCIYPNIQDYRVSKLAFEAKNKYNYFLLHNTDDSAAPECKDNGVEISEPSCFNRCFNNRPSIV